MIEWNDTSSWSKSDVDRTPKSWTTRIGRFRLVVHRHRDYEPDQWLATCYPDVFSQFELSSKDIDEAKCQAVAKLYSVCEDVVVLAKKEAVRREVAKKLAALTRKDVGTGDEGSGHLYDYADESKHGRWVEWDDIQKLIDELSA